VLVDIDDLPVNTDVQRALLPGAPVLWAGAPDNISAEMRHGDAAATAAAFAGAAHHIRLDLVNQRLAPSPIEPRSVLASFEAGRLTVRLSSQMPTAVRNGLADLIPGLGKETVRVLVGDVGGGFGMKTGIYAEDLAVAWAALQLKRPVKWQADRVEDFLAAVHGRDVTSQAEMALDAGGRVLALRVELLRRGLAFALQSRGTGLSLDQRCLQPLPRLVIKHRHGTER
jgi:carbon-monoxide dehydrogenase large subunit